MNDFTKTTIRVGRALDIARQAKFPELEEAVLKAMGNGLDAVDLRLYGNAVALAQPAEVSIGYYFPESQVDSLGIAGAETDLHIELANLGNADQYTALQHRELVGIVSEVVGRHRVMDGFTGERINLSADGSYLSVQVDGLKELADDLIATLMQNGFKVNESNFTPVVTLQKDGEASVPSGPTSSQVHIDSVTLNVKGRRYPLKLKPRVVDEVTGKIVKGAYTPITQADDEELRYTFSPWYVPDKLDAHGEWTDAKEIQKAFWNYLALPDRQIRLQHDLNIVAGRWVEGATWPYEATVPVQHPEGEVTYTFPANTPFLGIVWEDWAWRMIKAGIIRGLSIGGRSQRMALEMQKMVRREGDKYTVFSQDGSKRLGTYDTEAEAEKRLQQIEYFKHEGK
jgi:hypothetical protein